MVRPPRVRWRTPFRTYSYENVQPMYSRKVSMSGPTTTLVIGRRSHGAGTRRSGGPRNCKVDGVGLRPGKRVRRRIEFFPDRTSGDGL